MQKMPEIQASNTAYRIVDLPIVPVRLVVHVRARVYVAVRVHVHYVEW